MELKTYIAIERGNGRRLAEAIGTSKSYLSQLASGSVNRPEKICVAIEQATNGQVTRKDLHPSDWWLIWPELIEAGSHEIAL